jgi:hypothetical protein
MKLLIAVTFILAVLPVEAGDPPPFAPAPFQLSPPAQLPDRFVGIRLDLPIGPVRVNYGQPISSGSTSKFSFNVDGPGPGYRAQRARFLNK